MESAVERTNQSASRYASVVATEAEDFFLNPWPKPVLQSLEYPFQCPTSRKTWFESKHLGLDTAPSRHGYGRRGLCRHTVGVLNCKIDCGCLYAQVLLSDATLGLGHPSILDHSLEIERAWRTQFHEHVQWREFGLQISEYKCQLHFTPKRFD